MGGAAGKSPSLQSLIDAAADALRAGAPVFTRRNLFHAVRRVCGAAMTPQRFDAALRRRLSRGDVPGLLPSPRGPEPRPSGRATDASFPEAVLLVDRPAILDLFTHSGAMAPSRLAVVCVDGTPAPVVARLARSFQAGRRAPVLYVHDAATVIYPFAIEPLATLVRHQGAVPLPYADLGLPPLGATARRFHDPSLAGDEPILELEALPPATLLRYCAEAARRLAAAPGL